jgi:exonuclease VII large subunit
MEMKKIYLFVFTIALLAAGCGKPTSDDQAGEVAVTDEDELYQKVMAIHDEVMPKMNDIHKLKKQLEEEIKNSPDLVEERKQQIESRIKQLNEANENMMQWMRQFNPEDYKADKEEYLNYLNEELKSVKKVKEDMLKALE